MGLGKKKEKLVLMWSPPPKIVGRKPQEKTQAGGKPLPQCAPWGGG